MDKDSTKEIALQTAAEKLGVDLIVLFGSRADSTHRPDSDFDIAYRSTAPLDSEADHTLSQALIEYTGSENIHVLNIRPVKPLTLYEIMRNCKVLYAKDMMDFYELRVYAFRRFEDEVKPLFDMKFEQLKAEYLPQ